MKKQSFLKGAATIAVGGFIAKLIGALYRIPLTNIIGGYGMGALSDGLSLLLPPAHRFRDGNPFLHRQNGGGKARAGHILPIPSQKFLCPLSLDRRVGNAVDDGAFAPPFPRAGLPRSKNGYLALAPSVLLVSAISVFRGWFQGENNMFPTALSEVTEQVVKVGFGLLFAYLFRSDVEKR